MSVPEFDFVRHEQELAVARLADTLGVIATAEERLIDAELHIMLAQEQQAAAKTSDELLAASYALIMARGDLLVADLERVSAKRDLRNY